MILLSCFRLFWRLLQETVRRVLRDRCSVCPVCNVGVLWPNGQNGWIDQYVTWYGGRPRPRRHWVRWKPSSPTERGTAAPHFQFPSGSAKPTDRNNNKLDYY